MFFFSRGAFLCHFGFLPGRCFCGPNLSLAFITPTYLSCFTLYHDVAPFFQAQFWARWAFICLSVHSPLTPGTWWADEWVCCLLFRVANATLFSVAVAVFAGRRHPHLSARESLLYLSVLTFPFFFLAEVARVPFFPPPPPSVVLPAHCGNEYASLSFPSCQVFTDLFLPQSQPHRSPDDPVLLCLIYI